MVGAQVQSGGWVGVKRTVLVVLLVVCGCVVGGCSGDVAEKGSAGTTTEDGNVGVGIPVRTEDGRMLQPAGHRGLWFESEPEDPLDHVVWVSQRYVGLTIPVAPLGERAWSPGGAHLPDVCAPEIVDRMVEMGFIALDFDTGPEYVQCAVIAPYENKNLRGLGFFWGSSASVDVISQQGEVVGPDEWGYEAIIRGGLAEEFGCVPFLRAFSREGAIITYRTDYSRERNCNAARKHMQVVMNSLGGNLVQV